MKTTVRNLLDNSKESLFVNNYSPKHNLISYVICERKQTGQILNEDFRNELEKEVNIVEKTSKNGDLIAFSIELDLIARQKQN